MNKPRKRWLLILKCVMEKLYHDVFEISTKLGDNMNNIKLSKFVSYILRHNPASINIELDSRGYANVDALIEGIRKKGYDINKEILESIVQNDEKQRYAFNEDKSKINANYGHSIDVKLDLKTANPPEILYHGTSKDFVANILKEGIKKQNRQFVHLSTDEETALKVGKRHGAPVVLKIRAQDMVKDGIKLYKTDSNIWLTDYVHPKYIYY